MRQRRALRQFTLSTGKSAGRNSSGRITVFHRGGGSKRLQRRIDLKRSTSSMGIVDLATIVDKHALFIKVSTSLIFIFVSSFLYTYDRSFRVHQETLLRVHNHNLATGLPFLYTKLSVGHHGTVLKAVVLPKDAALAGQVPIPIPIPSPLEPFFILIGDLSFSMLLTLSLVLLLFFYEKQKK